MDGIIQLSRESPVMMNFDINLHLYINERGSDVYGEGLWKVSAWLTGDPQDEPRAYGFGDQVNKIDFQNKAYFSDLLDATQRSDAYSNLTIWYMYND